MLKKKKREGHGDRQREIPSKIGDKPAIMFGVWHEACELRVGHLI